MSTILDTTLDFEQGPIRPPNEAKSLLLRFTRHCPWNKCKFCPVYKDNDFSRRSLIEIKTDINAVVAMRNQIKSLSWELGENGQVKNLTIQAVLNTPSLSNAFRNVASWLYYDTGNVFLQDANNLVLKPAFFIEALSYLRQNLPEVKRVTTYARSNSAARLQLEDLINIRQAGLDRIHIGMETAFDPILKFMQKGVNAAKQIEGSKKIKAAGIELSEYIMPGLGGQKWSEEHAIYTAKALNQINPDFIRLRTLRVPRSVELHQHLESGEFIKLNDDQIIKEIHLFISNLSGITSYISSDHIMNLIETIEGKLPKDKNYMLDILDDYLTLPERQRLIYRFCRRIGRCREPKDLERLGLTSQLEIALAQVEEKQEDPEQLLNAIEDYIL